MAGNQNKENLEVNNHFLSAQDPRDRLGITLEKPKFPQYAVVSKREDSFKSWPEYLPLKPDVLVEAGLVYTGLCFQYFYEETSIAKWIAHWTSNQDVSLSRGS